MTGDNCIIKWCQKWRMKGKDWCLKVRDNIWQRDARVVGVVWTMQENLGSEWSAQTKTVRCRDPVHSNWLTSLNTFFRSDYCSDVVYTGSKSQDWYPCSAIHKAYIRTQLCVPHFSTLHPRPPSILKTLLHSSLQHSIWGVKLQILWGLFYSWESWVTGRLSGLLKVRNW